MARCFACLTQFLPIWHSDCLFGAVSADWHSVYLIGTGYADVAQWFPIWHRLCRIGPVITCLAQALPFWPFDYLVGAVYAVMAQ